MTGCTSHETAFLMLDNAPVGAHWTREDGSFAWVNQFACEMLGYRREELLALEIFSIDAHMTPEFWAQYWA